MTAELVEFLKVITAPATLILIGRYIIGRVDANEARLTAIEQLLNGYNGHDGLIERIGIIEHITDRRKN